MSAGPAMPAPMPVRTKTPAPIMAPTPISVISRSPRLRESLICVSSTPLPPQPEGDAPQAEQNDDEQKRERGDGDGDPRYGVGGHGGQFPYAGKKVWAVGRGHKPPRCRPETTA